MIITNETLDGVNVRREIYNEIYKVFFVNNVHSVDKSRSYENPSFDSWEIDASIEDVRPSNDIFLVIDTLYNEAFAHWVFESAIYLELFNSLKNVYPNIKLKLNAKRTFKILFCKLFNITEPDIVHELPEYNTCIFPSPIMYLNDKTIHQDYPLQLSRLFNYISQIRSDTHKDILYLLMPRQTKENFVPNDRKIAFDSIFQYFQQNSRISSHILHTDRVVDMTDQISILRASKNIILPEGSAFLVNGLFVQNRNIIVVGKINIHHITHYPKYSLLFDYITSVNNNTISFYDDSNDVVKYLPKYP